MTEFKVLSKEEIAKLNSTDKAVYMQNLAKYEAEQAKAKANADVKADEADVKTDVKADEADVKTDVKADEADVNADVKAKADKKEKVAPGNYMSEAEIEVLKKHNPTVKQFFITSDKVAFPQLWLAIDHEKNIEGNPDMIQEVK